MRDYAKRLRYEEAAHILYVEYFARRRDLRDPRLLARYLQLVGWLANWASL